MAWFHDFIKPKTLDSMVYQRGYKVGAARALNLPDNSFCGLSYAQWGEFSIAWETNTGEPYLPYDDGDLIPYSDGGRA